MPKEVFISTVKNNRLQPSVTQGILKVLEGHEGGKVIITVEKLSTKRSLSQNNYLHLLFTIFKDALNELGNDFTMLKVKELCKFKFALKDEINEDTGECIGQYIQHTSDMTKMEMVAFVENIIRWAADSFHIELPYPGEELELNFERAGINKP